MFIVTRLGVAAALFVEVATTAQARILPLAPGTYVRDGVQCRNAPFAAMLSFDGKALSDPHSSACVTILLRRQGKRFGLSTTCSANGDGSPATPYREMQTVVRLSSTHMLFSHATGAGKSDTAGYRLCAASTKKVVQTVNRPGFAGGPIF